MSFGRGKAPCGHEGPIVIGNFAVCEICDKAAVPEPVKREVTECLHRRISYADAQKWICADCGLINRHNGLGLHQRTDLDLGPMTILASGPLVWCWWIQ